MRWRRKGEREMKEEEDEGEDGGEWLEIEGMDERWEEERGAERWRRKEREMRYEGERRGRDEG